LYLDPGWVGRKLISEEVYDREMKKAIDESR